jgi:hypothetical protein
MTWRRDLNNETAPATSLVPAARTASANGTGVDLAGYKGTTVLVHFGVITDGTHTPKIQDSADNSTFADVAAEFQSGTFTAATSSSGGSAIQEVGYLGTARYLRVVMTVASATTGGLSAASIVRGRASSLTA